MKVRIPADHIPERTYAVRALFRLVTVEEPVVSPCGEVSEYVIILDNDKSIHVEDHFFRGLDRPVVGSQVPAVGNIGRCNNRYVTDADMPVIFGSDSIRETDGRIQIGCDVFASTFFMLTRWEEARDSMLDEHGRFAASESLAHRAGFLDRPVVDEYAAMLRAMIARLGGANALARTTFELIPTHDIDKVRYYGGMGDVARGLASGRLGIGDVADFLRNRDPYWNFGRLMTLSERHGLRSRFFFLDSRNTKYDNDNSIGSPRFKALFAEIAGRGHIVGLHGSYATFSDPIMLGQEKRLLEQAAEAPVRISRQHYLRFSVLSTYAAAEVCGLEEDMTAGYADVEGFRCGTGNTFRPFDLVGRREYSVAETPLVVMDTTLRSYRRYSPEEASRRASALVGACRKYGSRCAILFHNSSFGVKAWSGWDAVYESLLGLAG